MAEIGPGDQSRRSNWQDRVLLAWDLGIIALVSVNLILIMFDSLFAIPLFARAVAVVSSDFHQFYDSQIHSHFADIDLVFVAIFAADVLAGWAVAVVQQRYHRWFFYPFVHWYDVLGCIPLAGFRFLRVLRLISLGFRLQKMGVIDVRGWAIYAILAKYYNILMEELSDRVVVKVLEGVQDEVRSGGGELPARVLREVVLPRKQQLVGTTSARIESAVTNTYRSNREEIQGYVGRLVARAVEDNAAVRRLERLPMLGGYVTQMLEDALKDAVNSVLDEAVNGLDSEEFDDMVQHIADSVFDMLLDEQVASNLELREAIVEIIELLKEQVMVQQWKETYA